MTRWRDRLHRPLSPTFPILGFIMALSLADGGSKPPISLNSMPWTRGADLVLLNGKIWTGELAHGAGPGEGFGPRIQAVAISNGRFLAGGTNEEIKAYAGESSQVIDLEGRFA